MRLHRTTIAIFSLTILARLVWHLNWAANRFGFEEVLLGDYPLHLIVLAPAVGYFVGLRWFRYVVGMFAALLVPLLLLVLIALRKVDATPVFYACWCAALVVFVVTAITSFFKETSGNVIV